MYPTDTIWGIGCDATNRQAVQKIYSIKSRSEAKSLIILLDDFEKLSTYVEIVPEITSDLLASITNPVTIIYSNARRLAPNVVASDGTIAIRIVKDDFCKELIRQFGKPIVDFQAVQLKLADMTMKVEAARLLIYRAAQNASQALPSMLESSVAMWVPSLLHQFTACCAPASMPL